MVGRLVIQVMLATGTVIGRGLGKAFREAKANAAQSVTRPNNPNASAATKESGMTLEEAKKILNLPDNPSPEIVEKNFQQLYEMNNSQNAVYLSAKIFHAKERYNLEWKNSPPEEKVGGRLKHAMHRDIVASLPAITLFGGPVDQRANLFPLHIDPSSLRASSDALWRHRIQLTPREKVTPKMDNTGEV